MSVVVDYAWGRPDISALRASGASGVARYLSYLPNGKVIDRGEYTALRAAGLDVVLVWERDAEDFGLAGFDARAAAVEALHQARTLGYPESAAIYYALDWDVTASQWPTIRDRLRSGPCAVHGLARTGVYGPSDALEWARRDGVASWFWQAGLSTAWSGGRNRNLWGGAHLRQRSSTTIGGVECDVNDVVRAEYGQQGVDDMSSEDLQHALWDGIQTGDGTHSLGDSIISAHIAARDALAEVRGLAAQVAHLTVPALTDAQVAQIADRLGTGLDDRIEAVVRRVLGSLDNTAAT